MAAGPGFVDAEGIWRYGEADTDALFSDLLDFGQSSVSAQIAIIRAAAGLLDGRVDDLEAVTGVIASGTITALNSFNIDNLTGADDYEITITLPTASVGNSLNVQLRNNGVADATANYDIQRSSGSTVTASASGGLAATSWSGVEGAARTDKMYILRTIGLNKAERTVIEFSSMAFDAAANPITARGTLRHRLAQSWNGLGFTVSAGTATGRYEVRAR